MKYTMKMGVGSALLCVLLLGVGSIARAELLNYSINGTGSGSLGGASFVNANFTINMLGDTSLFNGSNIDPLLSASVSINGLGTTTINQSSRLGFNSSMLAIYFSRSSGSDFFDFFIAAPVNLAHAFGPISGTRVFALNQFQNVSSSMGLLSFNSSSDVLFQAHAAGPAPVPVPAAIWLFGSALAGLTGVGYQRRKQFTA